MLLGIKSKKELFFRHLAVAVFSGILVYLFFLSRPELSFLHKMWRATGDTGFVLLFLTLSIGPLAKLWKPANKFLSWRRELGIWFAILALIHTVWILKDWIRWDYMRFFGYEYMEQFGRYVRIEPGFGLANIAGLVAMILALVLLATSSDKAVNYLGIHSWKWLQYSAYTIFYLVMIHGAYFLFIHFTPSFHTSSFPENWFKYVFLFMGLIVLILQAGAFIKEVKSQKNKEWY